MQIIDLPGDLLLFIIQYVFGEECGYDASSFASVNRSFSSLLLHKARRIRRVPWNEKWRFIQTRSKLLQMVDSPYHQVSILGNMDDMLEMIETLPALYEMYIINYSQDPASFLSKLTDLVSTNRFKLKRLSIDYLMSVESFGPIPCLEGLLLENGHYLNLKQLNLPAFKSLRSLHISRCYRVEDVSSLDGIHEVRIYYCPKIRDISCLNHNYRVHIACCPNISTYSKSFRYSRHVYIGTETKAVVSLENCQSLKTLCLNGRYDFDYSLFPGSGDHRRMSFDISSINVTSLLALYLSYIGGISSLPPNRLQDVSIACCPDFKSLENMENIPSIRLNGLNITSLSGLGPKNRMIKLVRMNALQNISSLKEVHCLEILHSPNIIKLQSFSQLRVNSLTIGYSGEEDFILYRIREMKDLRELESTLSLSNDEIKALVSSLPQVNKFVLHGSKTKGDKEELKKDLHQSFCLTTVQNSHIILLRRI